MGKYTLRKIHPGGAVSLGAFWSKHKLLNKDVYVNIEDMGDGTVRLVPVDIKEKTFCKSS